MRLTNRTVDAEQEYSFRHFLLLLLEFKSRADGTIRALDVESTVRTLRRHNRIGE